MDGRCKLVLTSSIPVLPLVRVVVMPMEIAAPFLEGLMEETMTTCVLSFLIPDAKERPA